MKFIHSEYTKQEADVIFFGVVIGRFGKRILERLRKIQYFLESFDLDKETDLLKNVKVFDEGDLKIDKYEHLQKISEKVKEILSQNKIPLMVARAHLPTLYAFKPIQNSKLLIFDAHGDLKNEYIDEKIVDLDFMEEDEVKIDLNDATWLRRLFDLRKVETIQIGVRSCDEEELEFMKKAGIKYFTPNFIRENLQRVLKEVEDFTKNSKIYISLDMDCFDPSIVRAVDHPEPNGLNFYQFEKILESIKGEIVGMDVVCLKPIDDEASEFAAIRAIFDLLSLIK